MEDTTDNTVKYYRVQSQGDNGSFKRLIVNEDGTISIVTAKSNLSISTTTPEHAEYFKALRESQGNPSYIIEFEVPDWFDNFIMENAVGQTGYRSNPLNQARTAPKVVDPRQSGSATALELPSIWHEWLEEYATNAKILDN